MNFFQLQNIFLSLPFILLLIILSIILLKYFEWTVFIALLASVISAFFVPNVTVVDIESEATLGSYIRIALIFWLGVLSVLKIFKVWNKRKMIIYHPLYFLLFLIFLSFISYFYSIDQYISLVRSITFLLIIIHCIALYLWIYSLTNYKKVLNTIYFFVIFFILINILAIILLPFKAWWSTDPNRFQGILDQPNNMGANSRNYIFILLWKIADSKFRSKKILYGLLVFVLLLFIILSGSRTALITLFIGFGIWLLLNKMGTKIILFSFGLALLIFIFPFIQPSNMQRNDKGDMTDLTGRDEFWSGAILLISEKPILGYGFEVGGKIWEDPRFYNPKLTLWSGSSKQSLHNGYLSTAIGVGIPGFVIWLFVILYPLIKLKYSKISPEVQVFFIFLIIFIITNFVESTIGGGSVLFWLSWTMVLIFNRKIVNNK